MAFEPKDYVTLLLSAIALGLSVYNLVRARLDAKSLNKRTFEQKRFEAATIASEVKGQYVQSEGLLEQVRFEAMRANDPSLVALIESSIKAGKRSLDVYGEIEKDLRRLPASGGGAGDLLLVEKLLGQVKMQKASVAEEEKRVLNVVEAVRRQILAAAPPPLAPSSASSSPSSDA